MANGKSEQASKAMEEGLDHIRAIVMNGAEKFTGSSEIDRQFREKLSELLVITETLQNSYNTLAEGCHNYDFIDSKGIRIKANGYRSLLYVLRQFMSPFVSWLQDCVRRPLIRSLDDRYENLKSATRALNSLTTACVCAVDLMRQSDCSLIEMDYCKILRTGLAEDMARDVFYAKFLGFQYPSGISLFLSYMAMAFACYDHVYSSNEGLVSAVSSRFLKTTPLDEKERDVMIANVADGAASIQLARTFWSLPEKKEFQSVVKLVNKLFIPAELCTDVIIPPNRIKTKTLKDEYISLSPPVSINGHYCIRLFLVSNKWRKGQTLPPNHHQSSLKASAMSKNLIVHVHGGGFIATSPDSHEPYLRSWSRELDCPVVSIDYSLAPEAPYPRALEDCVFAFIWILNNLEALGTTGDKIILVGDSAGGNLVLTMSMRLKLLNVRLPDHVVSFYPATIVKLCVTPSKILSMFDLLLPLGIMISCLQAYIGEVADEDIVKKRREIRRQIYASRGLCSHRKKAALQGDDSTTDSQEDDRSSDCSKATIPDDPHPSIDELTKRLVETYKDSEITNNPFVSPALADDEMYLKGLPPVTILCGSLDPLLDDGIIFAQRLKAAGQPVNLQVLEGLPHGFLNLPQMSEDIQKAKDRSIEMLKEALDIDSFVVV